MNGSISSVAEPVSTKPVKKSKSKSAPIKSDLRPMQIKVLKLLSKSKGALSRGDLYLKLDRSSGLNDVIGKNDPKKRAVADEAKYPSLLTRGHIRIIQVPVPDSQSGASECRYEITAAGKKALAKAE